MKSRKDTQKNEDLQRELKEIRSTNGLDSIIRSAIMMTIANSFFDRKLKRQLEKGNHMDKYITCTKFPDKDIYQVLVSIPEEAYGITWYVTDKMNGPKSKDIIIENETTPICCLHIDEVKKNYEGKWLCCEYTLWGRFCQEVALYLSSDTLTMIRKNHFDVVDFFDHSNGYLQHEGEYKYRWITVRKHKKESRMDEILYKLCRHNVSIMDGIRIRQHASQNHSIYRFIRSGIICEN